MASIKELKELALHAVRGTAPANFSNGTVDEALRGEMAALAGTFNEFMKNRYDIFEIIVTGVDEVVPKKTLETLGAFAEIRTVADGQKAIFKTPSLGKQRAKKFLTQVGLSGLYETFRLDTDTVDVNTFVIGDAAYIDFERFLSGDEEWADYMEALMDGMLHRIYKEIYGELMNGAALLGAMNKKETVGSFSTDDLNALLKIIKAYGDPVIVATSDYINDMGDEVIESVGAADADKEDIRNYGRLLKYRGAPIVELPVSYEDETNTTEVFGGKFAFVLPSSGYKILMVAFEGNTIVDDWTNRDRSMEIQAYKKMGTTIVTGNNWGLNIIK